MQCKQKEFKTYKTFKKSAKYKKLVSKNIKISYKPKKIEIKIKNEKLSKIIEKNSKEIRDFNDLIENFKRNEERLLEEIKEQEENEQKFMGQVI